MKRFCVVIVSVVAAFAACAPLPSTNGSVSPALSEASSEAPAQACSLTCQNILAQSSTGAAAESSFNHMDADIESAAKRLAIKRRQEDIGLELLRANNLAVTTISSFVPVVGAGIQLLTDKAEAAAHDSVVKARSARVDIEVSKLLDQGQSPDTIRNSLSATVDQLIGPDSPFVKSLDLQPSEYDVLQTKAIDVLAAEVDRLKAKSADERRASVETDDQVRLDAMNIAKLNKQVSALEKKRIGLPASSEISDAGKRAADAVMTPQAKGDASRATTVIKLTEVAAVGKTASQQLAAASQILRDLKVNGPVVDDIALGAKALSAASALLSISNPLGALPAIAGVFGIFGHPSPDPLLVKISQQIVQIQQALANIQDEIKKDHDEEMREMGAVQNGLLELYSFLQDEQSAKEAACDDAYEAIDISRGIASPVVPRFSGPDSLYGPKPTLLNAPEFQPAGYEAASTVWSDIDLSAVECMKFLQGKFTESIGESAYNFRISSILQLSQNSQIDQDMRTRYSNSVRLQKIFNELKPIVRHISPDARLSWLAPPQTTGDLDWNLGNLAILKASLERSTLAGQDADLKAELISQEILDPDAISRAAAELLSISFWYDFIDIGTEQFLPLPRIKKNRFARKHLAAALNMVQVGQAQQSLLAGDFIVPLAYERITGDSSVQAKAKLLAASLDDSQWWNNGALGDLATAIADDKLLARNLGLYLAWRSLLRTGHSILAYRIAFAVTDDPSYMAAVLGSGGVFAWNPRDAQWTVTVASISLPLPSPEELSEGGLFRTGSFEVLSTVRGQLVNEIVRYDIDEPNSSAKPNDRELLHTVASVGALP